MTNTNKSQQLYFVRHGESQANADGVIAGSLDIPLAQKGIRQAEAVADVILQTGISFETIISSRLSRAYDTATIIAKKLGIRRRMLSCSTN